MLGRHYEGEECSAARSLELVGERWSLLILRDAMFRGSTRFSQFQKALGIATNILTKIALRQADDQNFLINRLAVQQLGRLADPASVPALVKGLMLFAPNDPAMRMNDAAADALTRIGRPAYQPLIEMLAGRRSPAPLATDL